VHLQERLGPALHRAVRGETTIELFSGKILVLPTFTRQFFTSRQRMANRLHEVPYFACFKPALPRFFIKQMTEPGDVVFDPFMGRGTTIIEAALLGRIPYGNDANRLSLYLAEPRLQPPTLEEVGKRLEEMSIDERFDWHPYLLDFRPFYTRQTFAKLCALRKRLLDRSKAKALDQLDSWIRMVVMTRLTGHSSGFLSRHSLPPNLTASPRSQREINKGVYRFSPEEVHKPVDLAYKLLASVGKRTVNLDLSDLQIQELQKALLDYKSAPPYKQKGKQKAKPHQVQIELAEILSCAIESGSGVDAYASKVAIPARAPSGNGTLVVKGIDLYLARRQVLLDVFPQELRHNEKLKDRHRPKPKDVRLIILKKTKSLLAKCGRAVRRHLQAVAADRILLTGPADYTPQIENDSVSLVVTSPPFLDVVDYWKETWLRCWFGGIAPDRKAITNAGLAPWQKCMTSVFKELFRVVRPGGHVVFEVGEAGPEKTKLETALVPCAVLSGFEPLLIMVNRHKFWKTTRGINGCESNDGTNTNRIVIFRKPAAQQRVQKTAPSAN
jgi:hypothetical protein